jgi:mRNA interferase RelE/StbE
LTAYRVFVTPQALRETKQLPGYVRQRVVRAISALAEEPRPPRSEPLRQADVPTELRRIRLARWRIVYAVSEADRIVDVLAVRRRPPYDYGDLAGLLQDVQ